MAIFYSFLYVYQRVDHFLTGESWISIAAVCLLRPGMEGMDFIRMFQRMWGVIYSQRQCLKKCFRGEKPQHDFWIHGFDSKSPLSVSFFVESAMDITRPMAMGGETMQTWFTL